MTVNLGLVSCLMWIYLFVAASSTGSDNSGMGGDTVDGEMLVKLGRRMKLPMLTLIGIAIKNYHSCSEWTQWSECSSVCNKCTFGNRKRYRTCNDDKAPDNISAVRTEEDFRLCQIICPKIYTLTKNGHCFKAYNYTGATWEEGEQMCQNDGGHLVYIDSDTKFSDVKKILEVVSRYPVWIDGRRKDTSSPWETVHGVKLKKFYWRSGEPGNESTDLCIVLDNDRNRMWNDVVCTAKLYYLCEIIA